MSESSLLPIHPKRWIKSIMADNQNADIRIAGFEEDMIREFLQIRASIAGGIKMVSLRKLSNSLNHKLQFTPEALMDEL